ncbi:hypothetical protein AWB67_07281 [Caballeronia terrestris]|uniref:Uncharacterized protein n=2 Tax=Caballeronia TaxID=1827195 RepID=A0A158L0A8_9BURK|nr:MULTISPECIES: hypothetical protein [Caballeronia]SAL61757.1 hypothetical protein AWB65_05644 [Caballeronia humi]SAL86797.1 hypothetical protein AWB67_07281 [Caballeronia terrestris]
MTDRLQQLLSQISELEDELQIVLHDREVPIFFTLRGKRVEFESSLKRLHRDLRIGLIAWLKASEPRRWVAAPFIYGLIVPLVLLDVGATVYQAICFPLFRIAKVKRADYIIRDRWQLNYLNVIEKLNCGYCEYANGLIAYTAEIAARTEQYWCPIKHARKALGTHARYQRFLAYGDAQGYRAHLEDLRAALAKSPERPFNADPRQD